MAAASKAQIDQDTRDKVNRIDQRVEEVVLPALEGMKSQLDKLSVVSKTEFAEYVSKTEARLSAVEKAQQKTAEEVKPIVKTWGVFNNRLTNLFVGALILGLIIILFSQASKLGIQL